MTIGLDTETLPATVVMPDMDTVNPDALAEIFPYEESDNEDTLTHIVRPEENPELNFEPEMTGQDIVDMARNAGHPVEALCGYRWVPVHNPDKYPVCKPCIDIAASILREGS